MWGIASLLRDVGDDAGFAMLVLWACGALYLACLAVDPEGIRNQGLMSFLAPSTESLERFGASGGVLHIVFNMLWVRDLAPATARLYGPGRAVIVYTVAGVCGFAASTLAFFMPFPPFLRGGLLTVGASAPIFGLLGALLYYGRRAGSSHIGQQAKSLAITMLLFGFVMPGIDNWAHLGGLGGGYLAAKILDPLQPERGNHVIAAMLCLALSFAAVIASVVADLPAQR
jgi:rhomboid protease GluP